MNVNHLVKLTHKCNITAKLNESLSNGFNELKWRFSFLFPLSRNKKTEVGCNIDFFFILFLFLQKPSEINLSLKIISA